MAAGTDAEAEGVGPVQRATWREWVGLVVLAVPMLVLSTDLTVLFLAMPSITADLQPGTAQMLWILHVYGFLIGGFLITMGRLGDRIGRRRLLMIGAVAFTVLSVTAAHSTSAEMLITARALLGVAGATLMPSAFSLLRNMFHDDGQRRFAIAVVFSAFSAGGAFGPLLGGALLEFFWWGSVFLVNVPALLVLLALGPLLLPEYREQSTQRLDLVSVGLSLGAMLGVVYGLQEIAALQESAGSEPVWPYVLVVVAGVMLALAFVHRQLNLTDPLLDLRLFLNRRFTMSLGVVFLTLLGLAGTFYLFTQYLQWVLALNPLRAGLWTVPYVALNIVGAMLAPALVRKMHQVTVMGLGLALTTAGLTLVAVVGGSADLLLVASSLAIAGLGQGAAFALASDLIISTAPAERAGSAAAMQEVSGELGTALGIAFGGTVGMIVYRATLADTMPDEVPAASADAAVESVSGAMAVAEQLPALGPGLLDAARDAFVQGFQTHAGVGAVLAAGVTALIVALRRLTAHDHEHLSG